MKTNKIILFRELCATQMNYWAVFPIILTAMVLSFDLTQTKVEITAGWFFLSLFPLGLFVVRRYVSQFLFFTVLHIGAIVLLAQLPVCNGMMQFVRIAVGVGFVIYSYYLRLCSQLWEDRCLSPVLAVLISGTCLFLLQYQGHAEWKGVFCAVLILVISLYFFIYYIESYLTFLALNANSASHIPQREMFRSGMKLAAGYTLCGALILLLTSDMMWLKSILGMIKTILITVLGFFFRLFWKEGEGAEIPMTQIGSGGAGKVLLEGSDSLGFWDILGYTVFFLVLAGLAYLLLRTVIHAVCYLFWHWKKPVKKLETGEFHGSFDVRERLQVPQRAKRGLRKKLGFLSVNEKIRSLYRKQALQLDMEPSKLRCATARECAQRLHAPLIGQIYEKARYSGKDCTKEELKQMKSACKMQ